MPFGENHTTETKKFDNPVQVDPKDIPFKEKHDEELRKKTAHIGQKGKLPETSEKKKDVEK